MLMVSFHFSGVKKFGAVYLRIVGSGFWFWQRFESYDTTHTTKQTFVCKDKCRKPPSHITSNYGVPSVVFARLNFLPFDSFSTP